MNQLAILAQGQQTVTITNAGDFQLVITDPSGASVTLNSLNPTCTLSPLPLGQVYSLVAIGGMGQINIIGSLGGHQYEYSVGGGNIMTITMS